MTTPQKNQSRETAAEPTVIYVQTGSSAYATIIPAKPTGGDAEEREPVER
ncbi:hypothetical protein [Azospirillum sp. SYSU D00513]|nr:hypothetical protein [Azospirillum sp. SYSU D00513]